MFLLVPTVTTAIGDRPGAGVTPRLARLAEMQRRSVMEVEADVFTAAHRAFERGRREHGPVLSWEKIAESYCIASAFVDVRMGWVDEEGAA